MQYESCYESAKTQTDRVLLVFELKYGYSTKIFTKQYESDIDGLSNFDLNAAQQVYIKLVVISEEHLFWRKNCLYEYNAIKTVFNVAVNRGLFTDCLTKIKTQRLIIQYFLHTIWFQQF